MSVLPVLPFVLPLLGAALALPLRRRPGVLRGLAVLVLTAVTGIAVVLLIRVGETGAVVAQLGGWPAPLGITLVADRLSALLLLVSTGVLLALLVYVVGEGVGGAGRIAPQIFYPAYLTLTAGVCLTFLAGDLFNLFVAFEVTLASSYVLLTLAPTAARMRAGMTYVVVSLTSSMLFLLAIAVTYAATGTVNLAQLAERTAQLPGGLRTVLALLFLVVFGIKSAIVPLHLWLPDSYPVAPTKITAVFAALLTKTAVYALIRTQTLLFPGGEAADVMLALAAATMVVGLLGALVQDDVHRVLSLVLVGHIGYLVFGLAMFSVAGLTGAILYLVHHIVVQAGLFLASGVLQDVTGETSLRRLGGVTTKSTFAAVVFFVPAMSVSGVPPMSGFVAKLALLQAGLASGDPAAYAVTAAAVATALLTLVALARVWTLAYWRPGRSGEPEQAAPAGRRDGAQPTEPGDRATAHARLLMRGATVALVAGGLVLAAIAGPLADWSERAATDLLDPAHYRHAVLHGGAP